MLQAQSQAGNHAVAGLLRGADPTVVQRFGFPLVPSPAKVRGWLGGPTGADDLGALATAGRRERDAETSPERTVAKAKVDGGQVQHLYEEVRRQLDRAHQLQAEENLSAEAAAKRVFAEAPEFVRDYLPLHDEFEILKREVNAQRLIESAETASAVSAKLEADARAHGYVRGTGDPAELSVKAAIKEVAADKAFQRQVERQAQRRLAGMVESARLDVETARELGDADVLAQAEEMLGHLEGPEGLEVVLGEMKARQLEAFHRIRDKKTAEHEKKAGVGKPGRAGALPMAEQIWIEKRSQEKVREAVAAGVNVNHLARGRTRTAVTALQAPSDEHVVDAAGIVGGVTKHGAKVAKAGKAASGAATGAAETLGMPAEAARTAGGFLKGLSASVGGLLKLVGGTFTSLIEILGQVSDLQSAKNDDDTKYALAGEIVGLAEKAAVAARVGMKAAKSFDATLKSDPGILTGVPIASILVSIPSIIGHVFAAIPPSKRVYATVGAYVGAQRAHKTTLVTAYTRSALESSLDLSTEVVGIAGDLTILGLSIAEVVTGGGYGAPAGLKIGIRSLTHLKKAGDWMILENQRRLTQGARGAAVAGKEGGGKGLFTHDITYAVDAIILAARSGDADAFAVVTSYGIPADEARRLTVRELHTRMIDKLGTDDDQKTVLMKVQDQWKDAMTWIDELGGEKEDLPLDEHARRLQDKADGKIKSPGIWAKALKGLGKVGDVTDVWTDRTEKIKRLKTVKNEVGYKGHDDRGGGFTFTTFLSDQSGSERRLRQYIVETEDPRRAAVLLAELNLGSERAKMTKKAAARADRNQRDPTVASRVITPELFEEARGLSLRELQARAAADGLSPADASHLAAVLAEHLQAWPHLAPDAPAAAPVAPVTPVVEPAGPQPDAKLVTSAPSRTMRELAHKLEHDAALGEADRTFLRAELESRGWTNLGR